MRYVVTGGAGFIGFHLCLNLLEAGHTVVCVDDLRSSIIPSAELRLLEMEYGERFHWHDCDLNEWALVYAEDERPCDGIYHLASPVGPAGVLPLAGSIASDILLGALAMAGLAQEWKGRLLFVSTSEVYGGGKDGYCSEEMPCVVPTAASARLEYAMGKLAAEVALRNLRTTAGLDVVIIRPFNIAGPGQNAAGGFVLPRFIRQAMDGEPLTVFSYGTARRGFTHVADLVDGLLLAFEKGQSGEVYNLGNPANVISIQGLAEAVIRVVGQGTLTYTAGRTVYGPLYVEAHEKYPHAAKAMQGLGWEPGRTVETIVTDTYRWLRGRDGG